MKLSVVVLVIVLLSLMVIAVDPPSLDNEQFYGSVSWDKAKVIPKEVIAKVGTNSYSSAILEVVCDSSCTGKYGYSPTNILRVQGKNGDLIKFYVDDVNVKNGSYVSGDAVKLDFDVTSEAKKEETPITGQPPTGGTPPSGSSSCSSWNCSKWTACDENGNKTQYCEDVKKCDPHKWNTTESKASKSCVKDKSGNFPSTPEKSTVVCVYQWYCTDWSNCFNAKQTRGCSQVDKCDSDLKAGKVTSVLKSPQPALSKVCMEEVVSTPEIVTPVLPPKPTLAPVKKENCFDQVKNQNEEDVDCGGVCKACVSSDGSWIWIILLSVIILVILGGGGYFFWKSRQRPKGMNVDTTLELRSAYDRGMQRGISQDEVTQKLIERGWDRRQLEQFLSNR